MKKITILLLTLSLFAISVYADDLSDYPDLFMKGNNLNVITIVGDKAPATHVLAQTQIALALSGEVGRQVPGLTRLSSEVNTIDNINVISIGNACDNPTSAEILGNPSPCEKDLNIGLAALDLVQNENGRFHLVLNAYGDIGIRKLADVLVNYEDFNLRGDHFEVEIQEEELRDFEEVEVAIPKPIAKDPEPEPEVKEEVKQEEPEQANEAVEETQTQKTGADQETLDLGSEPEPILKEENNVVLRIINWFKNLFG